MSFLNAQFPSETKLANMENKTWAPNLVRSRDLENIFYFGIAMGCLNA